MEQIVAGDKDKFRILVDKYQTYIYQLAYSILRHEKDAEDAAQEAFVQIYLSLPRYRSQGFKTWISRIAINKAIDYGRKKQALARKLTAATEQAHVIRPSCSDAEAHLAKLAEREEIEEMLSGMPASYRDVLKAYYLDDKPAQEIAAEQGISVNNVQTRLTRAKQWVRNKWNRGASP